MVGLLVAAGVVGWLVALGRQATPRPLRVPWRAAGLRDVGREARTGYRVLVRLAAPAPGSGAGVLVEAGAGAGQEKPARASGPTSWRSS